MREPLLLPGAVVHVDRLATAPSRSRQTAGDYERLLLSNAWATTCRRATAICCWISPGLMQVVALDALAARERAPTIRWARPTLWARHQGVFCVLSFSVVIAADGVDNAAASSS